MDIISISRTFLFIIHFNYISNNNNINNVNNNIYNDLSVNISEF